jgi:hypothetical protein
VERLQTTEKVLQIVWLIQFEGSGPPDFRKSQSQKLLDPEADSSALRPRRTLRIAERITPDPCYMLVFSDFSLEQISEMFRNSWDVQNCSELISKKAPIYT